MSSLAELFSVVGYKVDDASIKRYDAALEASKAKTKAMDEQSQALLKRMADLKSARDQEAAQVKAFIKLHEELLGKQETDEEKTTRVAKAMSVVGIEAKQTAKQLEESEKKARDWSKTVLALEAGLNLAGSAFGFVRGKIQGMLGELASAGGKAGDINALAARSGVATDSLQKLGYAAEQSGSNVQTLAAGWKSLANKADAAVKGSKEAQRAFHAVGLSAKNLRSGKTSPEEAIGKIAEAFKKMEDGPKKAALAMDLFSGSGAGLIQFLGNGRDGIEKLSDDAVKFGHVMSKDVLDNLAGFDDKTKVIKGSINALRTQALAAIVPALTKAADKFQAWLGQNREKAIAALTAGFQILVDILSKTADVITMLTPLITLVAENMDLITASLAGAVAGFAAYRTAAILASAGSVAAAITAGKAWAAANWQFVAIGLAVAALIKYWPQIKAGVMAAGRAIRDAFYVVKDAVIGAFRTAYEWVMGKIDTIKRKWKEFKEGFFKGPTEEDRKAAVDAAGNTGLNFLARQQAQSVPSSAPRAGSSTTIQNTITIPVTSNAADPVVVGKEVRTQMQSFWNDEMRKADSR